MAVERWIEVQGGQLVLVTELDGWAYLRAKERGKQTTWRVVTTLEELAATCGVESRLVHEARAALARLSPTPG